MAARDQHLRRASAQRDRKAAEASVARALRQLGQSRSTAIEYHLVSLHRDAAEVEALGLLEKFKTQGFAGEDRASEAIEHPPQPRRIVITISRENRAAGDTQRAEAMENRSEEHTSELQSLIRQPYA